MTAPRDIKRLIERFRENRDVYCSSAYNETQARHEFIDPLFIALGWDVNNEKGYAEAYKEVIHEDAIKVGGATKAPDYAFRIGGVRKFFVEAKRPGLNLKEDADAAYQLRRYAWSAKLPLSILTDFEEFAVYDCRIKPAKTDKASTGRVLYLTADEYAEQWDEIASIFSQDAILTGSFDKYAESTKKKKGTAEVDTAFLKEIEAWRDVLARNIALRNTQLSTRELNFAVQRTIDRLIFLRICEDRGVEEYGQLMALQNGTNTYKRLCQIFRRADERYNSGLFHFQREKDRPEPPDGLTLSLAIDDKVLKGILKELYYPESPYEFSVLPANILGQVYEQFLGKVIRLTAGHRAVVEDKPEVKKAGGVYYTPTYIVDYIVEHTVGKLLDGKTPQQVSKLRVLDPACGSGSFLLGAYQKLLDWHLKWYSEHDPEKHTKGKNTRLYRTIVPSPRAEESSSPSSSPTGKAHLSPSPSGRGQGEGAWRLTTTEKKRILLNTIYGVDIDPQAAEVTKLSLLLKVLEGENEETIGQSLRLFHERALPDLADNIKCGNSLIGPDFYEGKQLSLIDEEERYRINAFDWHAEFPHIFSSPSGRGQGEGNGFDTVIGNPPYIDIVGIPPVQRNYFSNSYSTFIYRSDILGVFFEKAITLLRNAGMLGFITSNTYFTTASAAKLRALLTSLLTIHEIIDVGGGVFTKANVDTATLVACKRPASDDAEVRLMSCRCLADLRGFLRNNDGKSYFTPQVDLAKNAETGFFIGSDGDTVKLVRQIEQIPGAKRLGEVVEFSRGYIAYDAHRGHSSQMIKNRVFHADKKVAKDYKKELTGSDIGRYRLTVKSRLWILFGDNLAAPRAPRYHSGPRVWIQRIRNPKLNQRLVCYYTDAHTELAASSGLTIARAIDSSYSACALCGLLNSHLINWYYRQLYHDVNIKPSDMVNIPIPLGWTNTQDRMVELVGSMLKLHKDLHSAKTDHEKSLIQRQIEETDKQIDQLVYELYSLTNKEIRIVEEATK